MLAIPVVDQNQSTIIMSSLYGNADYFAFVEKENITIKPNSAKGDGQNTAQFIIDSGATATLQTHMGQGLFDTLDKHNVAVFLVPQKNQPLIEVLKAYHGGSLERITQSNAKAKLDPGGGGSCRCGCE